MNSNINTRKASGACVESGACSMSCNMQGGVGSHLNSLTQALTLWFEFFKRRGELQGCLVGGTYIPDITSRHKGWSSHFQMKNFWCCSGRFVFTCLMFDGRCVLEAISRCWVTFITPIWLHHHCLTQAVHAALIKPTGSHTCVAAQLEFGQCQAPRPIDSSCMSYRTALVYCSWFEKASSVLACNDVLHLSLNGIRSMSRYSMCRLLSDSFWEFL